jgi:hypothetical protein
MDERAVECVIVIVMSASASASVGNIEHLRYCYLLVDLFGLFCLCFDRFFVFLFLADGTMTKVQQVVVTVIILLIVTKQTNIYRFTSQFNST